MINNSMPNRVLSLDFMRGFIMILLMLESAGLYQYLHAFLESNPAQLITF